MGAGDSKVASDNQGQGQSQSQDHPDNKKLVFEGSITEKKRSCTDVLMLLCLIACWVVMTIVGLSVCGVIESDVLKKGNPNRLTHPMDYRGSVCGTSPGVEDKPYGYMLPDKSFVCVKSCPDVDDQTQGVCHYGVTYNPTYVLTGSCNVYIASSPQFYRCIPDAGYESLANAAKSKPWFQSFTGDIFQYQGYIFGFGLGVSTLVAFLYLYWLRIPGLLTVVIWTIILSVQVALVVGAFLLWDLSNQWADDGVHEKLQVMAMTVVSYIFMGFSVLYFALILVLRRRVALAIGIVKEATRALGSMPLLIAFPIFQVIGIVLFLVPWVIFILYMASSGDIVVDSVTGNKTFEYSKDQKYAFLYMLFCWFWTSEFIIAIGQLVVSLCFATWYFTKDKSKVGSTTLFWAAKTVFFNHLGTAAFGSLIIAIIQTIRAVISYFQKQANRTKNKVMEYILCCIQCCMWCIEKCMKFLNKNAYIQTSIYGYSFCKAARTAFFLILRNVLRVGAVSMVGDFVLLLGKLFIPVITVFICYLCMAYGVDSSELSGLISPLIFVGILSLFIALMFSEVFGMGIETILCCYIADEEMFAPEDRYAENDLVGAIQKTKQAQTAGKIQPNAEPTADNSTEVLM